VIRAVAVGVCTLLLVVLLPEAAHACPVCFDASDENRRAFLVTTAFLSLLPLGMVMGAGLWIRKRSREIDGDDARDDPDPNRPEP
jgi:hypothetical protein